MVALVAEICGSPIFVMTHGASVLRVAHREITALRHAPIIGPGRMLQQPQRRVLVARKISCPPRDIVRHRNALVACRSAIRQDVIGSFAALLFMTSQTCAKILFCYLPMSLFSVVPGNTFNIVVIVWAGIGL